MENKDFKKGSWLPVAEKWRVRVAKARVVDSVPGLAGLQPHTFPYFTLII